MLLSLEVGCRLGKRRFARDPHTSPTITAIVDNAVFALFGLLVAFTFYGAAERFDIRRDLVITEANAIGTAYLRIDVVEPELQPALRDAFGRYVDSRLVTYDQSADPRKFRDSLNRSAEIQREIWRLAVAAGRQKNAQPAVNFVLLPALNEMIDITTTRAASTQIHPPGVVFVMLFALACTSSLLAGYAMASAQARNWLHVISYAAIATTIIYVILDYEYPRLGLIHVGAMDELLRDVRASMK